MIVGHLMRVATTSIKDTSVLCISSHMEAIVMVWSAQKVVERNILATVWAEKDRVRVKRR